MFLTRKKIGLLAGVLAVLLAGTWIFSRPAPKGIPILEYHMVDAADHPDAREYNVPPDDFSAQLDELQRQGYTTISLREFLRARKGLAELPEKPVVLTFDDGYDNNYTTLLPLLEARGMKATVFMVTNDIGEPGYLTWEQLRDMQQRGIEIGSHTANHQPLTEMSPAEADDELRLSKLIMEWNGLSTIYVFSYPNGKYNSELPVLLQKNEYLAAVTGDPGLNTFQTEPYLLQRTNIPRPRLGLWEFRLRLLKTELWTRLGIAQHLK